MTSNNPFLASRAHSEAVPAAPNGAATDLLGLDMSASTAPPAPAEPTAAAAVPGAMPSGSAPLAGYSEAPQMDTARTAPAGGYSVPNPPAGSNNPFLHPRASAAEKAPAPAPTTGAAPVLGAPLSAGEGSNALGISAPGVQLPSGNAGGTESAQRTDAATMAQTDADEQLAQSLAANQTADEAQWPLKDVIWRGQLVKCIMQNENGPCSLIALCNVLLLQGRLKITPPDRPAVSYSYLSDILADFLLSSESGMRASGTRDNTAWLSAALSALPRIQHGFQVDVRFDGPMGFANHPMDTPAPSVDSEGFGELALFCLANVLLVHGWLPDPRDTQAFAALRRAGSYNTAALRVAEADELAYGLLVQSTSTDPATRLAEAAQVAQAQQATQGGHNAEKIQEAQYLHQFLTSHATQLTPNGLTALQQVLSPGQLCVLFRNSHLSVLYRRHETEGAPDAPLLFTLVTDSAFLMEDNIVWESLEDVNGRQSHYYNSHFELVQHPEGDWVRLMNRGPQNAGEEDEYVHRGADEGLTEQLRTRAAAAERGAVPRACAARSARRPRRSAGHERRAAAGGVDRQRAVQQGAAQGAAAQGRRVRGGARGGAAREGLCRYVGPVCHCAARAQAEPAPGLGHRARWASVRSRDFLCFSSHRRALLSRQP